MGPDDPLIQLEHVTLRYGPVTALARAVTYPIGSPERDRWADESKRLAQLDAQHRAAMTDAQRDADNAARRAWRIRTDKEDRPRPRPGPRRRGGRR